MDAQKAHEIYQECLNMNLTEMRELIITANSKDEKAFFTDLYNYVLRKRQKECVASGIF